MQTEFTFYRDPAPPLLSTVPSATWQFPGDTQSRIFCSKIDVVREDFLQTGAA